MAISSLGVGSGLPLDELLSNLRNAENSPLKQIENRAGMVQSRLSAYGTVRGAVDALQTAASALSRPDTFGAVKASANADAFTASASPKAIPGEYRIEVRQLATRQTLTSTGQASRDTPLASGSATLAIELADGSTQTVSLTAGDTSLEGIVKAINATSAGGIHATLVNDGSANPHHLLLAAARTGSNAAVRTMSVAAAEPGTDVSALASLLAFGQGSAGLAETPATNAQVAINGIAVTSYSNVIENAIEGVTLSLARQDATDTLTLTRDDSAASHAIEAFVRSYNNLQDVIKTVSGYDASSQTGRPLTGDGLLRGLQSELRNTLNAVSGQGALCTLSQAGITTRASDGKLHLDNSKLAAALKDNPAGVQALFAGQNAIANRTTSVAERYVRDGGLIGQATGNMATRLKELDKQYNAATVRIDARMALYRKQFTQLDAVMSQMNSVNAYLTQQLSMLGKLNDKP